VVLLPTAFSNFYLSLCSSLSSLCLLPSALCSLLLTSHFTVSPVKLRSKISTWGKPLLQLFEIFFGNLLVSLINVLFKIARVYYIYPVKFIDFTETTNHQKK
jgi:hypothetical protein